MKANAKVDKTNRMLGNYFCDVASSEYELFCHLFGSLLIGY
jgi:hypothetical protein